MTVAEFRILADLRTFGPLTAGELADTGRFATHQVVAPMLKRMGERGLVRKKDPEGSIWTLTPKGAEVLDA